MEQCVIAYDFESMGGVMAKNGFTQLGAVLFSMTRGVVLDRFNMYANMKGYEPEKRCMDEFWSRPDMKERLAQTMIGTELSSTGPFEVVDLFRAKCLEWVALYPNTYLLTDCASYDSGLLKYFSRTDTMYFLGQKWAMGSVDSADFYLGVMRKPPTLELVEGSAYKGCVAVLEEEYKKAGKTIPALNLEGVSHDHNPVNDAEVIARKWHHVSLILAGL